MTVPLKPGWESRVSVIKPQIYSLGNKSRRIIDNMFDKIYKQGHLEYTTDLILFSFSVFVIYKTEVHGKRKSRAVVDIGKLNNLVQLDFYLLLFQLEIIANVKRCTNLAVLDAISFFYQWRLHSNYCCIFIVITHRSQKAFQVPIMGYINSVVYVQCKRDHIFRIVQTWA